MGLNTYPSNPFPPSTDRMDADALETEVSKLNNDVGELKSGLTNVNVALSVPDGTGKNIFDKNGSLENGKYIQANGTLTASTNWNTTDYQQITPNTYTMSGATEGEGGYYGICWYDSEKNYISGFQKFTTSPQTVTIPSNAQYVRYSVNNSALDSFMLEQGSAATAYAPYIPSVESRIEAVESGLSNLIKTYEQENVSTGATGYIVTNYDYKTVYKVDVKSHSGGIPYYTLLRASTQGRCVVLVVNDTFTVEKNQNVDITIYAISNA